MWIAGCLSPVDPVKLVRAVHHRTSGGTERVVMMLCGPWLPPQTQELQAMGRLLDKLLRNVERATAGGQGPDQLVATVNEVRPLELCCAHLSRTCTQPGVPARSVGWHS